MTIRRADRRPIADAPHRELHEGRLFLQPPYNDRYGRRTVLPETVNANHLPESCRYRRGRIRDGRRHGAGVMIPSRRALQEVRRDHAVTRREPCGSIDMTSPRPHRNAHRVDATSRAPAGGAAVPARARRSPPTTPRSGDRRGSASHRPPFAEPARWVAGPVTSAIACRIDREPTTCDGKNVCRASLVGGRRMVHPFYTDRPRTTSRHDQVRDRSNAVTLPLSSASVASSGRTSRARRRPRAADRDPVPSDHFPAERGQAR